MSTKRGQIKGSQYEREFNTAAGPYPVWYNYYRADPIKVPASLEEGAAKTAPDLAAHFFSGLGTPPPTTPLRGKVPTLGIWGMRDPYTLPQHLDGLHAYAPALARVRCQNGCPHPSRLAR